MSLTGPETSDYRRSGQAASKRKRPFVPAAATGSSEPILLDAATRLNGGLWCHVELAQRYFEERRVFSMYGIIVH